MILGQTRLSFPHSSSPTQKPATACSANTSHSCREPLIRLSRPVRKASEAARARLQSVRRADILILPGAGPHQPCQKQLCRDLWPGAPCREQGGYGHEILLMHFLKHLLVYFLIIVRQAHPFAEERHGCLKDQLYILGKALSFGGPGPKLQPVGARLNVLAARVTQEPGKGADDPILLRSEQMPCVVKNL